MHQQMWGVVFAEDRARIPALSGEAAGTVLRHRTDVGGAVVTLPRLFPRTGDQGLQRRNVTSRGIAVLAPDHAAIDVKRMRNHTRAFRQRQHDHTACLLYRSLDFMRHRPRTVTTAKDLARLIVGRQLPCFLEAVIADRTSGDRLRFERLCPGVSS